MTSNRSKAVGQTMRQEWVSLNELRRRWSLRTWREVLARLTKEGKVLANQNGWLRIEWK